MKILLNTIAMLALLTAAPALLADSGVLIPEGSSQPDPAIFGLQEMTIEVFVDNGTARVRIREIFVNRTGIPREGEYQFALPDNATINDFAVWDNVTRIPGVILERKRAGELYQQIKAQMIDPGLLQMGERGADEARRNSLFSARIVPIPAYGTKRIEIEYQQPVSVESLKSELAVPIHPDVYSALQAGHLTIALEIESAHAILNFTSVGAAYPLHITQQTPNRIKAEFFKSNVGLTEDFAVRWTYDLKQTDSLRVITEREQSEGFFGARALLAEVPTGATAKPRNIIALFDTSLSMQWDKLERSFAACETLLKRLTPKDTFNLLLFDSDVRTWAKTRQPATPVNVEQALSFLRASRIQGGTNLTAALDTALTQARGATAESFIVLIGDGGATDGLVSNSKIAARFSAEWRRYTPLNRPHLFTFAVGDDANLPLMRSLAANGGVFEWVRSTEPMEFKLNAFLSKIGQQPLKNLNLSVESPANFDFIYSLENVHFAGAAATWVGQYRTPAASANFTVRGDRDGRPLAIQTTAPLPAHEDDHPELPRVWAKARVDALLEKIDRDGEDQKAIDEIIRLSKKYKFVTPYTSFLAVPRALLRPRVIRPGDPVLRVHTDPSIVSVLALFPFGLVKPLRYLQQDDAWQARFFAPVDMTDGTYQVRLILRDREGHVYRETKSFVIASQAPAIRIHLDRQHLTPGGALRISVLASANTRTISARLFGAEPVALRWNSRAKANTGEIVVPRGLPPGRYTVTVTAEDIAHNIAAQEASVEIW